MEELLDVKAVSADLGTPLGTLAYWRHIGEGPPWAKLGRRVVYRRSDVKAWVDAQFAKTEKSTA